MSDSKPNHYEDEHQAQPLEHATTEMPAPPVEATGTLTETALEASRKPLEIGLNLGADPAGATLDARRAPAEVMQGTRRPPKRSPAKPRAVRAPATSYTVEAAASLLSLDPTALRARLRRSQRREGTVVVADLGGGISGFKLGKSWRLRFPER
jgi:hypothetical protein